MLNDATVGPVAKVARIIEGWDRLSLNEVLALAGWTVVRTDSANLGRRNKVYDCAGKLVASEAGEAWHALRSRGLVGPLSCEERGEYCWQCGGEVES